MDQEKEQFWYFTFCMDDDEKRNKYVKFYGTYMDARNKMFAKFGKHWAFQYNAKQIMKSIKEFGLTEYKDDKK